MPSEPAAIRVFEEHRELLMAVAYRVLGRVCDAEDVVQEAWLRWSGVRHPDVRDARAFLVRVTTRLAIDRLRRVQARREDYIGPWLPEPILTTGDAADHAALADSVSMAMLVVLETLSPLERAVFVLREAFSFPYPDIAEIIGRSEPAVRQLASRAREHVAGNRPRFDADRVTRRRVTEQFLVACASGNTQALLELLAPDVTLVGDGGGRAKAPLRTINGAGKVARFLIAIAADPATADLEVELMEVNGGPAVVATAAGVPVTMVALDLVGGLVQTVRLVVNPDKLAGLTRR
ncbi:MAG: RNA polymerase sigma-70 factor [Pseudonocardiaceae bacterium]